MFLCDKDGVVSCVNKGDDGVRLCNIIGGGGVLLLDTIDGVDGDGAMLCDIIGDDVVVDDIIGGDGIVSCSIIRVVQYDVVG